ncbi:MAG: serine acetyltransferase, partial [Verrucomicrobiales bacterium]|nr:serine acetyltransferase [Verrucomicrobiales bacterium]
MSFGRFRYLVFSDLYRIDAKTGWWSVLRELCFGEEGFCYCFWMRTCAFSGVGFLKRYTLHVLARLALRHFRYRYGIWIPYEVEAGPGLYLGHFGGVIVSPRAKIGRDVNLSHGVTLGKANRGKHQGYPTVGDGVFVGPGAVLVGGVKVGDGAAVGAICVVV